MTCESFSFLFGLAVFVGFFTILFDPVQCLFLSRAMVTLAEMRAKAEELKKQGVNGVHDQAAKRFAARGPGVTDNQDTLTKLLRFSLRQATAMDHLQQGAVIVFVVSHEPMQTKLVEAVQLWDQMIPPQTTPGVWTPHPW